MPNEKAKREDKSPNSKAFKAKATVFPGQSGNTPAAKRRKVIVPSCPSCNKRLNDEQVYEGETGGHYVVCPNTFDVIFVDVD